MVPIVFGSAAAIGGVIFVMRNRSRGDRNPAGLPGAEISEEERHEAEEEYEHELELEHRGQSDG